MANRKITILSEDFPPYPGGIAQWAAGIGKGLVSAGNEVTVLFRPRPELAEFDQEKWPFRTLPIEGKNWKRFRTWISKRAVKNLLATETKPDLIIATTWNMARGIVSLCKDNNIPLILVVHGLEVTRPMPFLKKLWLKHTLNKVTQIVAVSQFTKDQIDDKYRLPEGKVVVLPNGVDVADFFPVSDVTVLQNRHHTEGKKVILTFARVIERKGHDVVIKSLPKVKTVFPDLVYLVCGKGDAEYISKLKTLAKELGVEDDVVFTGFVDPKEKNLYYNLCDVYIMPSREINGDTEGFGITYLEANACEKPVIGGNSGGVADAIIQGETGFLVDPLDVKEIEGRLLELLGKPELAMKIGKQGRERILKSLTWEAVAKRLTGNLLFFQTQEKTLNKIQ
ncbi:MAG: glycosyltransferase family 4 protein [Bacteroidetes bacterium]|nr:glycosyltransferase family 4 protein [Bacteroidota bacterium]